MDWRYGEPALDELLSDPIVLALMQRDRVERRFLSELVSDLKRRQARDAVYPCAKAR